MVLQPPIWCSPLYGARRFSNQPGVLGLATEHAILVTGLDPATTYPFEAVSRDASGNISAVAGSWTTTSPAPRITSVVPSRAAQGASLELTVNGEHFGADAQVDLGAGVALGAVAVNAAGTQLRATITVTSAAAEGLRSLAVTTGGQAVTASLHHVRPSRSSPSPSWPTAPSSPPPPCAAP
ncbi:MAG: hypothetical protein GY835_23690 [bacterium]|nr:hypothetical protein [bacterium]